MPAPDVFGDGLLNPLPEEPPFERIPYKGILYATDREPASKDEKEKYYLNERGFLLRLGVAQIQLGEKRMLWDIAREYSMLKARTGKYPLSVEGIEEWGILKDSVPSYTRGRHVDGSALPEDATEKYARQINAQLALSKNKDVYIYVHGYKVVYENPLLVASELWHFLGYDGAFIAYSWPSTPSTFAYIRDSETSQGYARNFRLLLEHLANETDAERIHIIGYSNGTRLVCRALEQLALKHHKSSEEELQQVSKIGKVILVGSDVDRGVFGAYISDGLLNVPERMTIYVSKFDKALGMSQWLTRRNRIGQMFDDAGPTYSATSLLEDNQHRLSVINVSDAEGAGTGNGHGYFRNSPWASSDILMSLAYDLDPEERGLVKDDGHPLFTFPENYVDRLQNSIMQVDPEFAEEFRARMGH